MEDEAVTLYADEAIEVMRLRRLASRWRGLAYGYRQGSEGEQRALAMASHFTSMAARLRRRDR